MLLKQKPAAIQAPLRQCSPLGLPRHDAVGVVGKVVVVVERVLVVLDIVGKAVDVDCVVLLVVEATVTVGTDTTTVPVIFGCNLS